MSGRLIPFRKGPAERPRGAAARSSEPRSLLPGPPSGTATLSRPIAASRFRELVGAHLDAVYSLARYLARDPVAAEDIAQEALMKAFRSLETLRGDAVRPWLLAIVRNAYFDWRRRTDDRVVTGPAAEVAFETTPDTGQDSAETALIRRGDVEALRGAIETIPEPFREALVLRDLEELSYRDVAHITGAPMGTVMSRLARARRMLAERMGVVQGAPA